MILALELRKEEMGFEFCLHALRKLLRPGICQDVLEWRPNRKAYVWNCKAETWMDLENPMLEMPECWDPCQGELLTGVEAAQVKEISCTQQSWINQGIWRAFCYQAWRCSVWSLPSWFSGLLCSSISSLWPLPYILGCYCTSCAIIC